MPDENIIPLEGLAVHYAHEDLGQGHYQSKLACKPDEWFRWWLTQCARDEFGVKWTLLVPNDGAFYFVTSPEEAIDICTCEACHEFAQKELDEIERVQKEARVRRLFQVERLKAEILDLAVALGESRSALQQIADGAKEDPVMSEWEMAEIAREALTGGGA